MELIQYIDVIKLSNIMLNILNGPHLMLSDRCRVWKLVILGCSICNPLENTKLSMNMFNLVIMILMSFFVLIASLPLRHVRKSSFLNV